MKEGINENRERKLVLRRYPLWRDVIRRPGHCFRASFNNRETRNGRDEVLVDTHPRDSHSGQIIGCKPRTVIKEVHAHAR